jgi:hypothetical protein
MSFRPFLITSVVGGEKMLEFQITLHFNDDETFIMNLPASSLEDASIKVTQMIQDKHIHQDIKGNSYIKGYNLGMVQRFHVTNR